jgi:hypothetical protein
LQTQRAVADFIATHQGADPEHLQRDFIKFSATLRAAPHRGQQPLHPRERSRRVAEMSKLNATDIQGFTLRGYNLPVARYLFLRFRDRLQQALSLIAALLPQLTTGQKWDNGKPDSTLNIALTYRGLVALELPPPHCISFPVEFQEGMKARAEILGDTGMQCTRTLGRKSGRTAMSTPGSPSTAKRLAASMLARPKCFR